MAKHDWPDDEKLLELIVERGGKDQAARALGVSPSTLRNHLKGRGLWGKADAPIAKLEPAAPDEEVSEVEVLRHRLAEYEKRDKRERKEQVFEERALEDLRAAAVQPVDVPAIRPCKPPKGLPAIAAVAPIFDQQYGQQVRAEDTPGGVGRFNTTVFDTRLQRYTEALTGILRDRARAYRIDELVIPFGGDHVEGDEIFPGQAWQLEIDPPTQVVQLAAKMAETLKTIVRFAKEEVGVKRIGVYGVTGNHGKVGGKKSGARPGTYNWDHLFLTWLRDKVTDLPIDQFEVDSGGALFFATAGHTFLLTHGDQIRGWGGIPHYGLQRFDARAQRAYGHYDYHLLGHHHQRAEIGTGGAGEHIISGDWVGANNLSRHITAFSRPQQAVIFVRDKWGVMGTERIYFTRSDEAYPTPLVHGKAA